MRLQVGLMLSEVWTLADPRDLRGLVESAVVAEEAGVDLVMIGEHVVMGPSSAVNGLPANPRELVRAGTQAPTFPHPSALHLLSAVAARTTRLRLLAAGLLSPLRHPLLLAKELATVDLLSNGRLVVVPIVSWQEEEYEALGVPFDQRGEILDEQLEIWRRLWREGSPISHHGSHFDFDDVYVEPAPTRPGGPTIWTGGRQATGRVVRRAVRHADGLFTLVPPDVEARRRLQQEMEAHGRRIEELEVAALLSGSFEGPDDLLDLDEVLAGVPDLAARGVSTFILKPSQFIDDLDELGSFCERAVGYVRQLDSPVGDGARTAPDHVGEGRQGGG